MIAGIWDGNDVLLGIVGWSWTVFVTTLAAVVLAVMILVPLLDKLIAHRRLRP